MTEQSHRHKESFLNKKRSYARKMLRAEIEDVKSKVRAAYTLQLKQEEGYELTSEEQEIVEEAPMNQKFTEKLESMLARQSRTAERPNNFHDDDVWTLLRFFYLGRLAQQGFFYLIASVYPFLEPQAITFLCDKMVGSTLYASRATLDGDRKQHRNTVKEIVRKLRLELDEPVANGFKTTYKQIMHAIHSLADQSVAQQQQSLPTDQEDENEENEQTSQKQPQVQTIPPIWVVMPYASMMDGNSFAPPGSIPTLPYPTTMLPMGLPTTYPTMQHPDHKRRANGRKDQKKKSHRNKKDEHQRHDEGENRQEDEEGNKQEDEEENKQEDEEENKQEDEVKQEEQSTQYNYNDDRFADAETTDEEEENEPQVQDKSEEAALIDGTPQASQANSDPVTPIASIEAQSVAELNDNIQEYQYEDIEQEQANSQEVTIANNSWRTFVASSTVDAETDSPTSPNNNTSPRTAKSKRYSNNKY